MSRNSKSYSREREWWRQLGPRARTDGQGP